MSERRRVRILNGTPYPADELRRVLFWVLDVAPARPARIEVRIRARETGTIATTSPLGNTVHIGLAQPQWYPNEHHYPELRGAPRYTVYDWREDLVVMVAHELEHVAGGADELEAEHAAVRALRAWRHEHPIAFARGWIRAVVGL